MDRITLSKKLGANIKRIRTQRFLSQESLALDAGMHPAYLGQLERGEKCPNIDTLLKICNALNISPAKLLDFETEEGDSVSVVRQRLEDTLNKLSPQKQQRLADIMESIVETITEGQIES